MPNIFQEIKKVILSDAMEYDGIVLFASVSCHLRINCSFQVVKSLRKYSVNQPEVTGNFFACLEWDSNIW